MRADASEDADPLELARLAGEGRQAMALLGACGGDLLGFPDNRFDTVALLDLVKAVERSIATVAPHTIYTQHGDDLKVDHQLTFRAVLAATRPMAGTIVREVLAFEVGSSTERAFQKFQPAFRPNVFVDITATLDRKIDVMHCYVSETRPFPHPRSAESLRARPCAGDRPSASERLKPSSSS